MVWEKLVKNIKKLKQTLVVCASLLCDAVFMGMRKKRFINIFKNYNRFKYIFKEIASILIRKTAQARN